MKNENLEILENKRQELIDDMRLIPNTESTEYMDNLKDLETVNKQIQMEHTHEEHMIELELKSRELDIRQESMERDSIKHAEEMSQRKSDNKVKLGVAGLGAGVTIAGYLIVSYAEQTQALVSKLWNLIPKRKVD